VFGLFTRRWAAGHDGFRRRGPYLLGGLRRPGRSAGCLVSGL